MENTYKAAGVDIDAGENTVKQIVPLVKSTHNKNVLSDIGLFGGFYDAKFDVNNPVLVASTDGVGTKLKIAFQMKKHNTIGCCLVNHCVNDILCCGAKPLFFLDYFATGKLIPSVAVDVISGFVAACRENNCALIGGETAEMPSIYNDSEYDISGTIVGVVDKEKIVNGSKIREKNVLIGLESSGLHTNGYSLARNILFSNKNGKTKYSVDSYVAELGATIGEALLSIHKSYLKEIYPLVDNQLLTGISHITGGGIIGNTSRIVPKDLVIDIDWNSWKVPAIFDLIRSEGNISDAEMRRTFNLGIGMILIAEEQNMNEILERVKVHNPKIIGKILAN